MSAPSPKKSKNRGILSLTRMVRDVLPEKLQGLTDSDPTDQLPGLKLGDRTPGESGSANGGAVNGTAMNAAPSFVASTSAPVESPAAEPAAAGGTSDGLRRLAERSRVPLGDFSPGERSAAVLRLEDEIHQRLARWLRLEDELRSRVAEIGRLQADLATSLASVTALEEGVRRLTGERDEVHREAERLRTELTGARRSVGSNAEQMRVLEEQTRRLTDSVDDKSRLLREAEARIQALTSELEGHRDALLGLQGTLTDQQDVFERQEEEKAVLADTIRNLQKNLADSRAQQNTDNEARAREIEAAINNQLTTARAEQSRLELAWQDESRKAEALHTQCRHWEAAAIEAETAQQQLVERLQTTEHTGREREARLQELEGAVASLLLEQKQLNITLTEREHELQRHQDEVSELEKVGGALTVTSDSQLRTIDALHAQLRTQKKLVGVLSNGVKNVDEVAATVASLDAWVSEQIGTEDQQAIDSSEDAAVRLIEAIDGAGEARYRLSKPVIMIGRSHDSDIRVGGKYTSRHHARILNEGTEVVIEDLGSANGIMVNESQVARCVLHHGDVMEIGGSRFRFVDQLTNRNRLYA